VIRLWFLFFIAMVLAVIAARTFIRVKDGEGVVVFRLGQPLQVSGPGLVMIIPFIDRVVTVSLDSIAGWETMPEDELKDNIVQKAMSSMR